MQHESTGYMMHTFYIQTLCAEIPTLNIDHNTYELMPKLSPVACQTTLRYVDEVSSNVIVNLFSITVVIFHEKN